MRDGLAIEYVDPAELKPAPYNPRRISEEGIRRLAKLLEVHGFVDPVIARREDKLIIGGHQRIKANALCEHPDPVVPVVFLDGISDERAKALNIALNNQEAQGVFDAPKLADLLQEIDTGEFDVPEFTAFSAQDIAGLMHGLDEHSRKPAEEDWAAQFEADGDTSGVDRLQQITFVLAQEDMAALVAHLKAYDAQKNAAIVKWLQASS